MHRRQSSFSKHFLDGLNERIQHPQSHDNATAYLGLPVLQCNHVSSSFGEVDQKDAIVDVKAFWVLCDAA